MIDSLTMTEAKNTNKQTLLCKEVEGSIRKQITIDSFLFVVQSATTDRVSCYNTEYDPDRRILDPMCLCPCILPTSPRERPVPPY